MFKFIVLVCLSYITVFLEKDFRLSEYIALVGRIDENMDESVANVEGAQSQLMRYLNSISSNRWLMIKIFFILIVFLMFFLFFVA